MRSLTNEALMDAYDLAQNLQLDFDFIVMLEQELKRRGLKFSNNQAKR